MICKINRFASCLRGIAALIGLFFGFNIEPVKAEPARIYDQHPLGAIHLSTVPQAASTIGKGSLDLQVAGAWSNTVNRERGSFLIDSESRQGELTAVYGVSDKLDLMIHQAVVYRGGGFTDHPIEEWHSAFGLPDGPRVRIPEDEFVMEGELENGESFNIDRQGTHLGGLDLGSKYTIYNEADLTVSYAFEVRLPTGANAFSPDVLDLSGSFLADRNFGDIKFSAGMSYFYLSDTTVNELRFERQRFGGFGAVEYVLNDSFSLLGAFVAQSKMVANVPEYPDYQTYLDFGFRAHCGENTSFEFVVRENPTPDDSTADITLYVSAEQRFGGVR